MTSFGTKTISSPEGPSLAYANSIATSTARKHAKQDVLAQATATAFAGNNRLSFRRFMIDATPQRRLGRI